MTPGRWPAPGAGRRLLAAWVAATLWVAASGPAGAATVWGLRGSGVLFNPPGDAGPPGEFTLGFQAFRGQRFTFARYQLTPAVELGLVMEDGGQAGVGPLVSVRLWPDRGAMPAVSVGWQYQQAFVVASRAVGDPWTRAHLGLKVPAKEGGLGAPRVFAGIGRVLNPVAARGPGGLTVPILSAGVEFDGEYLNAALSAQLGRSWRVDIGVQDRGSLALAGGISIVRQF